MAKKQKPKRHKPYRGEAYTPEQPVIHKYVAEDEEKRASGKRAKRKLILFLIAASLASLISLAVF
jgi:hypothetical protein